MGLNQKQFRELILRPTLIHLGMYSAQAEELLMATANHESAGFSYLHQVGGPALGFFQIEPATHHDVYENFLRFKPELLEKVRDLTEFRYGIHPNTVGDRELFNNLSYQVAIARLVYYRKTEPIPNPVTEFNMAEYWKTHYNTPKGRGTVEEFIASYQRHTQ